LGGHVRVRPGDLVDQIQRVDTRQQHHAGVGFGSPQRLGHQCQRFQALGRVFRPVGDFANADNHRRAVGG
jgi:hypothetical protein